MSTYAIGDIQGCYTSLQNLLTKLQFEPKRDRLWFAGDLVNRGPQSLNVLRFIANLPNNPVVVLGNHDLHLLAAHAGIFTLRTEDTLQDVLAAPDATALCNWLRQQPFIYHDASLGYTMTHAGIAPHWTLQQALHYGTVLNHALVSPNYVDYLQALYSPRIQPTPLLRELTDYFTRMRFCDINGQLELTANGPPGTQPAGFMPWYEVPNRPMQHQKIIFGHWAALQGQSDHQFLYALDTGCVYGNELTALCLETRERISVQCAAISAIR